MVCKWDTAIIGPVWYGDGRGIENPWENRHPMLPLDTRRKSIWLIVKYANMQIEVMHCHGRGTLPLSLVQESENTHTVTGTNTQARTPLISSALLCRWYSALCPLTQCMPLITNSHDKSIAHRIHDGRWRVFLLGHSYWTFWLHTTLKIGFQSTWGGLFNSATVRILCCLPTMAL